LINSDTAVSTADTATNGQTATAQQTASGNYRTTTTATLTIGGMSGAFNVTTLTVPVATTIYTSPSATGSGGITASFTGGGAGCGYANKPVPPPLLAMPPRRPPERTQQVSASRMGC
jgi:hypothetical protein